MNLYHSIIYLYKLFYIIPSCIYVFETAHEILVFINNIVNELISLHYIYMYKLFYIIPSCICINCFISFHHVFNTIYVFEAAQEILVFIMYMLL